MIAFNSFKSGFSCEWKAIAQAQVLIWVGLCGQIYLAACVLARIRTEQRSILRCLIHNRPQGSLSVPVHRLNYACVDVCLVSLLLSAVVVCCSKISLQLWLLHCPPLISPRCWSLPCQLLHVVSTCTCCHLFVTKELRTFVSCKVHLRSVCVCSLG